METSVRLPRLAASAIGVAIVAASAFAIAAPASAATPGVTYVHAADFTAVPGTTGFTYSTRAPTNQLTGVRLPGGSAFISHFAPGVVTDSFGDFLAGTTVGSTALPADASTILGFYTTASASPTGSLSAAGFGYTTQWDPAVGLWQSNATFGSFAAFTPHTLDDFTAEAAIAYPALTIAYLELANDTTVDFSDLLINGNQYLFTPTPVSTAATSITQAEFETNSHTVTTTGFLPGEAVEAYVSTPSGGGNAGNFIADANGTVTATFSSFGTPEVGDWTYTLVSEPRVQVFTVTVTASASTAALAATGTDSFAPLAAGGVLLLGGAALAIVAIRKRRTV